MNILVVDDDKTNLMLARVMLEKMGHEVQLVTCGDEALVACSQQPDFEVVLMDLNMPGIDGYETTRQLRSRGCKAKVVALTANDKSQVEERYRSAGMDAVLTKPINMNSLREMLMSFA